MTRTTKTLLILSVAGFMAGLAFVTGIVNVQSTVAFYTALPLGAVFLGLFLIFRMLEKEVSLYDEEQQRHLAPGKAATPENSASNSHGFGYSKQAHTQI